MDSGFQIVQRGMFAARWRISTSRMASGSRSGRSRVVSEIKLVSMNDQKCSCSLSGWSWGTSGV